ncbi:YebC/PmpR family DNA-binding transcriptional regulator [Mesoplasma lactucae]|uniref:Probable transcriptional regulatory protein CP520_00710 n=1 Tax=Mesoplasma lactucae ATCC 49193 TaxID=81460 RepID=A0A291IR97_9MOLU|nr:YebC/PmpR family DNA-binding transcriptional regulator [Mesoplasma lactucae]ATG97280.1 YebC/PmpR family DNA-binding transcriptional regulator [Mesoplasma lactucae ATCC 49193]ATZ20270.1 transcriptional regulator [Mesoplasma lactucae ATCC 49193]MCL8216441.1 putative transcriptional regulatory protein YeeN [Mesoplasma lactucae ATCC 49193]
MGRAHEVRAASMAKTAAKKSAANGRAAKEIYMVAKNGGTDPNANLALRAAMDRAKSNQVPVDVINRAIKRAEGGDAENFVQNRYEGYGPGSVAIIVDSLTSNVNRAIAEIRDTFNKNHGKLGSAGSVAFLFQNLSLFEFEGFDADEVLMYLMEHEVDVNDVEQDDDVVIVKAPFTSFASAKAALDEMGVKDYLTADIKMVPDDNVEISDAEAKEQLTKLLDKLDELEDVQAIYHNANL